MAETRKLGLVLPTLNEAGNITLVLDRIQAALDSMSAEYEIVVVDGGSADRTLEIAQQYAASHSRVKALADPRACGLAGAVIHGWRNTDAPILGVMDADLQHPPELLPQLLQAVEAGCDLAVASRYVAPGAMEGWSRLRRLVSIAATAVTAPLLRRQLRIKDPLAGFFLVRRESIAGVPLHAQGFKILLEILVCGRVQRAAEIPFRFGVRHAGKSKASLKTAWEYGVLLKNLLFDHVLAQPATSSRRGFTAQVEANPQTVARARAAGA